MFAAPATAQIGSLTCSSNNGKYRYCRADTQNIVGSAIASSKSDNDDVAGNRRDYYLDGYRHGQRDWDDDRRPDYQRYLDRFPREYETDFSTGYNDGYNNRPSKYR
jgi:hypothetical protein